MNKKSLLFTRHTYHWIGMIGLGILLFIGLSRTAYAQTPVWSNVGTLQQIRYWHTATLLPNGKVLVVGGCNDVFCEHALASAELYDPATGTWSATGNLHTARQRHTATLLPNGLVLVAGGGTCDRGCAERVRASHASLSKVIPFGPDAALFTYLASAELYDPVTG